MRPCCSRTSSTARGPAMAWLFRPFRPFRPFKANHATNALAAGLRVASRGACLAKCLAKCLATPAAPRPVDDFSVLARGVAVPLFPCHAPRLRVKTGRGRGVTDHGAKGSGEGEPREGGLGRSGVGAAPPPPHPVPAGAPPALPSAVVTIQPELSGTKKPWIRGTALSSSSGSPAGPRPAPSCFTHCHPTPRAQVVVGR